MSAKKEAVKRRDFLKLAAVSAPAAVAVAVVTGDEAEAAVPVTGMDSGPMQDTAHTRAYLASARF